MLSERTGLFIPELQVIPEKEKRVVYTTGSFDLLHQGHVLFLKKARELGDFLIVSLNTDEYISTYKRCPIMNWEERASILSELRCVDLVIPHEGIEDERAVFEFGATVRAVGRRNGSDGNFERQIQWLEKQGVQIIEISEVKEGASSSNYKRKIYESFALAN